jgi:hypothetical protein
MGDSDLRSDRDVGGQSSQSAIHSKQERGVVLDRIIAMAEEEAAGREK